MRTSRPSRQLVAASAQRGLTILELMIVLAIIGSGVMLARSAFRTLSGADLMDNSTELVAVMRRAGQLATETGEMHRVVFDLDKHAYQVEMCQGATAIARNEQIKNDGEVRADAMKKAQEKMRNLPSDAFASGDPDVAAQRTLALAGQHVADRTCVPATAVWSGDAEGRGLARALRSGSGVKLHEIWVQHLDDGVQAGQVSIAFFPNGSAEKAVVAITDGSSTFSVLVYGLTGRVELRDSALRDVDDHMLRNAVGDQNAEHEEVKQP